MCRSRASMPDFVYGRGEWGSLGLAHAARLLGGRLSVHPVPDILTRRFLPFSSLARILVRFVRAALPQRVGHARALLRSVATRASAQLIAIGSACSCLYSAR